MQGFSLFLSKFDRKFPDFEPGGTTPPLLVFFLFLLTLLFLLTFPPLFFSFFSLGQEKCTALPHPESLRLVALRAYTLSAWKSNDVD